MRLRPKFFVHILIFTSVIVILIQPSVLITLQNYTPKEAYPNGSIVITTPAQAEDEDQIFCYIGDNSISVTVLFYNTPEGNPSWMFHAINEFAEANISISITAYHWENESQTTYYDLDFEQKLNNYRNADNSMLIVSFTNLAPQPVDRFGHLAGYSRVQNHIAMAFMPNLETSWAQYIMTHEMAHNLGYFPEPNGHSSNQNSLMYPVFSGNNIYFDSNDLNILENLHD